MKSLRPPVLAALVATGMLGCGSVPGVPSLLDDAQPDLIPLPAAGFCQDDGMLQVAIRNQDAGNANPSTTRVSFSRGTSVQLRTPEVEGGRIVTLDPITIPPECFAPDCLLTVTADLEDDVDESNEDNNIVDERCPAPS